jgi:hypothetical protein
VILPVLQVSADSFDGQEFVHVYPKIKREELLNGNHKAVVQARGKSDLILDSWQRPTGRNFGY